jgi:hypothetical protein
MVANLCVSVCVSIIPDSRLVTSDQRKDVPPVLIVPVVDKCTRSIRHTPSDQLKKRRWPKFVLLLGILQMTRVLKIGLIELSILTYICDIFIPMHRSEKWGQKSKNGLRGGFLPIQVDLPTSSTSDMGTHLQRRLWGLLGYNITVI